MKTLVAGFGNLLLQDDGFGAEVARRLGAAPLPPDVEVLEVGIGGMSFLLKLMEGFDRAVVVDTAEHGGAPGSLVVFAPSAESLAEDDVPFDPHQTEPLRALRMARRLGVLPAEVTVVACRPVSCELEMERTPEVERAIEAALDRVRELIGDSRRRTGRSRASRGS